MVEPGTHNKKERPTTGMPLDLQHLVLDRIGSSHKISPNLKNGQLISVYNNIPSIFECSCG